MGGDLASSDPGNGLGTSRWSRQTVKERFAVAVYRCDGLNLQPKVTVRKLFGCRCVDLKLSMVVVMVVGLNCGHEKARAWRALVAFSCQSAMGGNFPLTESL